MYYICDYAVLDRWSDSSHCRGIVFATRSARCPLQVQSRDSSHCRGIVFATSYSEMVIIPDFVIAAIAEALYLQLFSAHSDRQSLL